MKANTSAFFKEVTLRICGSLDIKEALSDTFAYLEAVMPVDAMALLYTDPKRKRMISIARMEREGVNFYGYETVREIPLYEDYFEDLDEMGAERTPVFILNRPEDWRPEMLSLFPGLASNSTLSLQLRIRGDNERVGIFAISAKGTDRYGRGDALLLESVREPIAIALSNARRYRELLRAKELLAEDNRALSADIKRAVGVEVVGADFGLREVMEKVRQIAPSNSPALLLGETGTGKEVIANAIHMASPRRKGPMISMQCGAIPDTLLDSELFGHEKGAFTGATERKRGRFERAEGGTLFLDEIGELSQEAQVKLLRVLQEKEYERVGGTRSLRADVRVIAATHRDLPLMVREGTFREDLWYRLNVLPIHIPPLRLRKEDIPSLVQYFMERKSQEMNLVYAPQVDSGTLELLKAYHWPGNVRELQNIVERALILSHGSPLIFPDLGTGPAASDRREFDRETEPIMTMDQVITNHIRRVLERVGWQVAGKGGAAEILKMNPSTLRFRMRKLGITKYPPR